jgi:hypothetical protein
MPSSMPVNSPSTTTPISSSSRFSARPSVPSAKRMSSFAMTEGRPSTCAMPSAASETYPDLGRLRLARLVRRDELRESRTDLVGADGEFLPLSFPFLYSLYSYWSVAAQDAGRFIRRQPASFCLSSAEARGDAAVDDVVADLHADSADDGGVDDGVESDPAAGLRDEALREPAELLGQRAARRS